VSICNNANTSILTNPNIILVGQHLGAAIFYGGYRTQELDLYREEKWKYHNMGAIELAATAYSREVVIERVSAVLRFFLLFLFLCIEFIPFLKL